MKLVIFDIDGTLTHTSRVDEICFVRAWAELHGIEDIREHWSGCPHVEIDRFFDCLEAAEIPAAQ